MTDQKSLRVAVDRREGNVVVLVDDQGKSYDVQITDLPNTCRTEGAVLDVPLDGATPRWRSARRNHAEEGGRLREAGEQIARLKRRDPGGDVEL